MVGVESIAMGSGRSKAPLHNFTLPCGLKWGNQKFLRCAKLDSSGAIYGSSSEEEQLIGRRRRSAEGLQRRGSVRNFRDDVEDGIAAVRKKLMCDLQAETDKMKDAILRKTGLKDAADESPPRPRPAVEATEERSPSPLTQPETATEAGKRWNLRTRRTGSKQPNGFPFAAGAGESNPGLKVDVPVTLPANASPVRSENKSPRLRSSSAVAVAATAIAGASSSGEKRERAKFSVPLARREIEEDFSAMINHRPPRRPKKRAKYVQRNLDSLFPGLWLTEITPDLYKVPQDQ